jgi:hypothetical protein
LLIIQGLHINNVCSFLCFLRFRLFKDEALTMHTLFAKADRLTSEVIGAANLVRRNMGPGLVESIVPIGLSFKFHEVKLVDEISKLILSGANQP